MVLAASANTVNNANNGNSAERDNSVNLGANTLFQY